MEEILSKLVAAKDDAEYRDLAKWVEPDTGNTALMTLICTMSNIRESFKYFEKICYLARFVDGDIKNNSGRTVFDEINYYERQVYLDWNDRVTSPPRFVSQLKEIRIILHKYYNGLSISEIARKVIKLESEIKKLKQKTEK